MKAKFFLHVKKNGAVRVTKTQVSTFVDEITVGMEINLPDTLFEKPIINGKITVTDDMVSPNVLDADVKQSIENTIKSIEGVVIELVMPKED